MIECSVLIFHASIISINVYVCWSRLQVDAATGAESMVEKLTDRNLALEEKVQSLQEVGQVREKGRGRKREVD